MIVDCYTKTIDMKKIAILATDGFEQSELEKPLKAMKDAGHVVEVISLKSGAIKGWDKKNWGAEIPVDKTVDAAAANDYDAVILPGGVMNPDKLRTEASVQKFLQEAANSNKLIAAICHAPWSLVDAGLVKGKKMTSYHTIAADLKNAGAIWEDSEVVIDGQLITSRKPEDIPAFNEAILEKLKAG
jgi:protease I